MTKVIILQLLGNLYPQMEGRKGQAALEHFKRAAEKTSNSGQVLEMLGELLATVDPQGKPAARILGTAQVIEPKRHILTIKLQSWMSLWNLQK